MSEKAINEAIAVQRGRINRNAWNATDPPRVLVTGMGPIGFTAVVAAVARGWGVTMLGRDEPSTFRARLVEQLGGTYHPLDRTNFQPADVERDGYDLLVECTGSDAVMLRAAGLVRSCGVVCWLGSSRQPQPAILNVQQLMRDGLLRNHVYIGCVNAAPRDFHDALEHLALLATDRRAALAALITERVGLEDSLRHYSNRQPQGIKVVVQYDERSLV